MKKVVVKILGGLVILGVLMNNIVMAETKDQLQNEQKETQNKINETKEDLEDIQNEKSETMKQVEDLSNKISDYQQQEQQQVKM